MAIVYQTGVWWELQREKEFRRVFPLQADIFPGLRAYKRGAFVQVKMSRTANLSIVFGIVPLVLLMCVVTGLGNSVPGVAFLALAVLCPLAAAFLGHWVLRQAKMGTQQVSGSAKLRANIGLATGYIELLVLVLIFLGTPERPNHMAANEGSAVGSLRSLQRAAAGYATEHPNVPVAADLKALVEASQAEDDRRVDRTLLSGVKKGYRFTYAPDARNADGRVERYKIYADPVKQGQTGVRHFYTDETGIIRYDLTRPADSGSAALQ
jgi:type IV pilus assembly protein PilA